MLNLSDKDIDRLSREAADQYETDANISSWEKLELELDKEIGTVSITPVSPPGRRILIYIAVLVLSAAVSLLLMKPGEKSKTMVQKDDPSIVMAAKPNKSGAGKIDPSGSKTSSGKSTLANGLTENTGTGTDLQKQTTAEASPNPLVSPTKKSNQNKTAVSVPYAANNKKDAGSGQLYINKEKHVLPNPDGNQEATAMLNHRNKTFLGLHKKVNLDDNKTIQPQTTGETHDQSASTSGQSPVPGSKKVKADPDATAAANTGPFRSVLLNIQEEPHNLSAIPDSSLRALASKINQSIADNSHANQKPKPSMHINRSLHIGILLAPDFTNVGNAANNRMSSNLGLTLGYHVFNNLSLNSGLILTTKNYDANGNAFHAPANSWINWVQLDNVRGSCYMIEIPLTVRYDYTVFGKTRFFISGGISSYLMRHESYDYTYTKNGYISNSSYSYYEREIYWFSAISLSLGLEQQISKSLSVQVEPFVKLPLSGIGYGNLQLSTYGLGLSLRYSPVIGKSRH